MFMIVHAFVVNYGQFWAQMVDTRESSVLIKGDYTLIFRRIHPFHHLHLCPSTSQLVLCVSRLVPSQAIVDLSCSLCHSQVSLAPRFRQR